jgi:uncharacterized protein YciI
MKSIKSLIFILTLSLFVLPAGFAQEKPEPPSKLVRFYLALLKKGPKWGEQTKNPAEFLLQYMAHATSMFESGQTVIIGATGDDGDLRGIEIFRARYLEDAKLSAQNDPLLQDGQLIVEVHPWWSEDIFKKPRKPFGLTTVYLALLSKGPNRKEGDSEDRKIQELQKAHIANIQRLAEMKKLVAAGPFGDDGNLRGIFVLRVGSFQEAQELCATDPMVKVGRLTVELHPWQVPEGVLP